MKYIITILLLCSTLFAEVTKSPIKWKNEQVIIRDSLYVKEFNDIRFRAQYDSLEQILAGVDSISTDSAYISPGFLIMQPGRADTLTNKPRIYGDSNVLIEAPESYTLRYTVSDTSGFGGERGCFRWNDQQNITIRGGKYEYKMEINSPGCHLFYFNGSSNINIQNLTIDCQTTSTYHDASMQPFMFINCDTVTIRDVYILNNSSDAAIGLYGCKKVVVDNVTIRNEQGGGVWGDAHTCVTVGSASQFGKDGTDDVRITNCNFWGGTHSLIDVENNVSNADAPEYDIRNVIIDKCTLVDTAGAISGVHIYGGRIQNVTVSNTRIIGASRGIYVEKTGAGTPYVKNIKFLNLNVSGCSNYGAWIRGGSNIDFNGCVFDSNGSQGIKIDYNSNRSDTVRIWNTRCNKNINNGIWNEGESANNNQYFYVANCECNFNGTNGIALTRADVSRVMGNNLMYNGAYGLSIGGVDTLFVSENVLYDNGTNDNIYVTNCTDDYYNDNIEGAGVVNTDTDAMTLLDIDLNFNDTDTEIYEDGSDNLTFKDANAGTKTLMELSLSNSDIDTLRMAPGIDTDIITATLPNGAESEFLQCTLNTALVNIINQDGHIYTPKVNFHNVNYAGGVTGYLIYDATHGIKCSSDFDVAGDQFYLDSGSNNWNLKATASSLEFYKGATLIASLETDGTLTDEVAMLLLDHKNDKFDKMLYLIIIALMAIIIIMLKKDFFENILIFTKRLCDEWFKQDTKKKIFQR